MSTHRKFVLLAALYLSQGLPYGFFVQALPVLLRKQGVSLEAIGLTSMLALPWALKFAWAPWIERSASKRRWIMGLQLAMAIVMAGLAWFDPSRGTLWALYAGVLITNALCATQDIATDGLAVELLSFSERGVGNGLQVAAYRVGMIVGGGAMLWVYARVGWWTSMTLFGVLILAASVPIMRYREPRVEKTPGAPEARSGPWRAMFSFVRAPGAIGWLVLIGSYKFGESMGTGMLRPYLVDSGWGEDTIGWVLGGVGFGAGLVGALGGGWLSGRIGRHRTLLYGATAQIVGVMSYGAFVWWGGARLDALVVATLVEHLSSGVATAALFTMMMDRCDVRHGATHYTLQACVVVIAAGIAQVVSGYVASRWGYEATFWLASILCACAAVGVVVWQSTETRRPALGERRPPQSSSEREVISPL